MQKHIIILSATLFIMCAACLVLTACGANHPPPIKYGRYELSRAIIRNIGSTDGLDLNYLETSRNSAWYWLCDFRIIVDENTVIVNNEIPANGYTYVIEGEVLKVYLYEWVNFDIEITLTWQKVY